MPPMPPMAAVLEGIALILVAVLIPYVTASQQPIIQHTTSECPLTMPGIDIPIARDVLSIEPRKCCRSDR